MVSAGAAEPEPVNVKLNKLNHTKYKIARNPRNIVSQYLQNTYHINDINVVAYLLPHIINIATTS